MAEAELLDQDDTTSCPGKGARGCDASDPGSHHDDVGIDHPRGALSRYGVIPRAAFEAARARAW